MNPNVIDSIQSQRNTYADVVEAYDIILAFERERAAELVVAAHEQDPIRSTDAAPVVVYVRATRKQPRPSHKSHHSHTSHSPAKPKASIRDLVLDAISDLQEPFNQRDIRDWMDKHHPEAAGNVGRSTWGTTLLSLRQHNLIAELADKKAGQNAYKRGRNFKHTADTTAPAAEKAVADRYQEFRSTVPAPQAQD